MQMLIYFSVLLGMFMIIKGDLILNTSQLNNLPPPSKSFSKSKLVPATNLKFKVGNNNKKENISGIMDRMTYGRAVFLPFFNRPYRPRPRITSFMRRTGNAEFHPLHKYCVYRIYRYGKR